MRRSRTAIVLAMAGGFAVSFSAWAEPGGNGGGKKGGQGGGESSLRLCADFNDPDAAASYIDEDAGGQYCDGTDGEILIADGLKFSTSTRNPAERTVTVSFQGGSCDVTRDADFAGWTVYDQLSTFFANAQSTEFVAPGGCAPGDPFDASFDPASLECLQSTGTQLPVGEMRQGETRYTSMRVNLTEPGAKKAGNVMVLTFAEDLGPNTCAIGADALPLAIACTAEESEACSEWHLRSFRACAFDYDTSRGGGWVWAGSACPVSTDMTFTVKP